MCLCVRAITTSIAQKTAAEHEQHCHNLRMKAVAGFLSASVLALIAESNPGFRASVRLPRPLCPSRSLHLLTIRPGLKQLRQAVRSPTGPAFGVLFRRRSAICRRHLRIDPHGRWFRSSSPSALLKTFIASSGSCFPSSLNSADVTKQIKLALDSSLDASRYAAANVSRLSVVPPMVLRVHGDSPYRVFAVAIVFPSIAVVDASGQLPTPSYSSRSNQTSSPVSRPSPLLLDLRPTVFQRHRAVEDRLGGRGIAAIDAEISQPLELASAARRRGFQTRLDVTRR